MVPPIHGDTTILDKPEMWLGKSIEEIVNYRLSLVRGVADITVYQNPSHSAPTYFEVLYTVPQSL